MTAMTMMMVVVVMRTICEVRWSKVTLIQKVTQPGVCGTGESVGRKGGEWAAPICHTSVMHSEKPHNTTTKTCQL